MLPSCSSLASTAPGTLAAALVPWGSPLVAAGPMISAVNVSDVGLWDWISSPVRTCRIRTVSPSVPHGSRRRVSPGNQTSPGPSIVAGTAERASQVSLSARMTAVGPWAMSWQA